MCQRAVHPPVTVVQLASSLEIAHPINSLELLLSSWAIRKMVQRLPPAMTKVRAGSNGVSNSIQSAAVSRRRLRS
jgi:hypothetical protein